MTRYAARGANVRKTKRKPARRPRVGLTERVRLLELDMRNVKTQMHGLSTEIGSLQKTVTQVDARTLRGEKLMLEMQGEQLRTSRTVDRIAEHFKLDPEPRATVSADPGDTPPPDADEPE